MLGRTAGEIVSRRETLSQCRRFGSPDPFLREARKHKKFTSLSNFYFNFKSLYLNCMRQNIRQ